MSLAQVVPYPHFRFALPFPVYPLLISFLQLTVSVYVNFPFFDAVFLPLGTLLVATLVTLCHSFIYNEVCECGGNWMMLALGNVLLNQYLLSGSSHAPLPLPCSAV